jgi:hypothetical protein
MDGDTPNTIQVADHLDSTSVQMPGSTDYMKPGYISDMDGDPSTTTDEDLIIGQFQAAPENDGQNDGTIPMITKTSIDESNPSPNVCVMLTGQFPDQGSTQDQHLAQTDPDATADAEGTSTTATATKILFKIEDGLKLTLAQTRTPAPATGSLFQ